MTYLATLKFRETFPRMGTLLHAVNSLLDSGEYKIHHSLNPAHPKHLCLEVYGKKTSHPTLKLDLPLALNTSDFAIAELSKKIQSSQSVHLIANDDSVSFAVGMGITTASTFTNSQVTDPSEIVFEHTFVLRKPAPALGNLLDCLSNMINADLNYTMICSSDHNSNRWLKLNLFYTDALHPVAVCSRRLKVAKKEDFIAMSKINIASSQGVPILFSYDEDNSTITAKLVEPDSPTRRHHLLLAFQTFQAL